MRCNFKNVYTSTQSFFELRNGQFAPATNLHFGKNGDVTLGKLSLTHVPSLACADPKEPVEPKNCKNKKVSLCTIFLL